MLLFNSKTTYGLKFSELTRYHVRVPSNQILIGALPVFVQMFFHQCDCKQTTEITEEGAIQKINGYLQNFTT